MSSCVQEMTGKRKNKATLSIECIKKHIENRTANKANGTSRAKGEVFLTVKVVKIP
jgi:hypothetical protein